MNTLLGIPFKVYRAWRGKRADSLLWKCFEFKMETGWCHGTIFSLYKVPSVLFCVVWVGCVGDRMDVFCWLRCFRWEWKRNLLRFLCGEGQRILKLLLPYLPVLKKAPKLCHQGRNDRNYLHKIVCCVGSVETRPPFLWIGCQTPKITLRVRVFPLWCFAFPCCIELWGWRGWGNSFIVVVLHCGLSHS